MQNTTPLFPGFHLSTLRKTPRSASQKLADEIRKIKHKSFSELAEYFSNMAQALACLTPMKTKNRGRNRAIKNQVVVFLKHALQ